MSMTDDDIKREISRAWEWQHQESVAVANAFIYLTQAANGEVPHGGIPCPSAPPVTTTLMTETLSSSPTDPTNDTTKIAGTTGEERSGTATSTDTTKETTNE